MKQGKISVSIDGIEDSHNQHSYAEEDFLPADEEVRAAVGRLWEAGARVENIADAVAGALYDQMGGC